MIKYDVEPSKMMFKAICKHTKPLKHTKSIEILTNYIKKKHDFFKISYKCLKMGKKSKAPILIFCMLWM